MNSALSAMTATNDAVAEHVAIRRRRSAVAAGRARLGLRDERDMHDA